MKLISLNIWGGHVLQPLLDFIKTHREVDIFCFQEVYHRAKEKISTEDREVSLDIFNQIQTILKDHQGFFRPVVDGIYGVASFVKKNIDVLEEGELSIYVNPDYIGRGPRHSRNLQWLECQVNQTKYSILNIHGLWNGKGKTDTLERLTQSERIRDFMSTLKTPKLLCGDFNLRPDTSSLKMLEKDMENLIKIYNFSSTRTRFYEKEERFADYILTSPEVQVNDFCVLKDEVSDHSPLFLDFQV
jgi:endonuclease/exonuclease/phosphatase family metal-dependent hydrolase